MNPPAADGFRCPGCQSAGMAGLSCSIVVKGDLDERFDGTFADLSLRRVAGGTELAGHLRDQSELEGVLRQLFDLGLDVVAFTAAPEPDGRDGRGQR